jgi:dolichol kinase
VRVTTHPTRKESLRAKLHYALASFCTLALWNTPCGVGAFAILAIGDALSNLAGQKLGGGRGLFYNPKKTLAGSFAFGQVGRRQRGWQ